MERYHYTECGLDNIYLENGFAVSKDGVVSIENIHGLHEAIGMILVFKPSKLSGKEVRFIRHTLDLSQSSLAKLMGTTYQSVLGWEKGKSKITKSMDRFLRTLFYAYLARENDGAVYDKINEIADIDAKITKNPKSNNFKMARSTHLWKTAA